MQEYGQDAGVGGFEASRGLFESMVAELAGPEAGQRTHADLEVWVQGQGRELLRRLFADHLELRAVREERRSEVAGADGVVRTRAERGHERGLATVFGPVTVSRLAYRETYSKPAVWAFGHAACWSWRDHRELYSGKHKTTGHNLQVVTDMNGDIKHVSDPMPGSWHDVHAYEEADLLILVNGQGIGDKGYVGRDLITPIKKPQGGQLIDWQKSLNQQVNSIRAAVERGIANLKTWRILHTDYRRPLRTFRKACRAAIALYFFTRFG